MADFEEVLSKAIAGLSSNSSELRRALYDKARKSLVSQLKSITPELPQTEIAKQRLALEHAIRKVESQAILIGFTKKSEKLQPPQESITQNTPQNIIKSPPPISEKVSIPNSVAKPAEIPLASTENPTKTEKTVRNAAQEQIEIPPISQKIISDVSDILDTKINEEIVVEKINVGKTSPTKPKLKPASPIRIHKIAEDPLLQAIPEEYSAIKHKNITTQYNIGSVLKMFQKPQLFDSLTKSTHPKNIRKTPKFGRVEFAAFERKNIIRFITVILVLCAVITLFLSSNMIGKLITSVPKDGVDFKTAEIKTNKFTNRLQPEIEQNTNLSPSGDFINIAQTAILYEENPNIPQKGESFKGQTLWTVEQDTDANGKIEKYIRGSVNIPDRKIALTLILRRNFDTTIPASHTAELRFELAPDFIQKGISSIPGILVKPAEQAKGTPLIGASARITNNYFLVAFSNQPIDKERNIASLQEKNWFEIPILYETRLRAVLVMHKGNSGERVFQQVFDSWK